MPVEGQGGRDTLILFRLRYHVPASTRTADLMGSERVRRHPHRRARSAPPCGVSRVPRAYRVRVPIRIDRRRRAGRTHLIPTTAASTSVDIASVPLPWRRRSGPLMEEAARTSLTGRSGDFDRLNNAFSAK